MIGEIGVNKRHRASLKDTVMYMAAKVAEMALKDAAKSPKEVDVFILANWTDRYYLPDLAPQPSLEAGSKC